MADWLTVPEVADRFSLRLSAARQLIVDREVLSARIGAGKVVAVPTRFFDDAGPRPELRGTFTVLADGGLRDDEIIEWLFTPDPTLPVASPSTRSGPVTRPRCVGAPWRSPSDRTNRSVGLAAAFQTPDQSAAGVVGATATAD